MPKYCLEYFEVYTDWYDIEAETQEIAEKMLERKILTGELEGPKHCHNSGISGSYIYKEEEEMAQRYVYAVQVCYDRQYGYETVTEEDTMEEAQEMLKTYRENEPEYPSRITRKRATK